LNNFESNELWKSRFYVLDDLGKEDFSSPWLKEAAISKLHRMLQFRRNKGLATIITSNYSPEVLSNRYEGNLDSLLGVCSDGEINGDIFKSVKVGGYGDLRLSEDKWDI
jgi:DNA replication protein DnaC